MIKINQGKLFPQKKISEGSFGSLYTAIFISKDSIEKQEIALKSVVLSENVKKEIIFLSELSGNKGFPELILVVEDKEDIQDFERVLIGT